MPEKINGFKKLKKARIVPNLWSVLYRSTEFSVSGKSITLIDFEIASSSICYYNLGLSQQQVERPTEFPKNE